jgi:hypothetical protein
MSVTSSVEVRTAMDAWQDALHRREAVRRLLASQSGLEADECRLQLQQLCETATQCQTKLLMLINRHRNPGS